MHQGRVRTALVGQQREAAAAQVRVATGVGQRVGRKPVGRGGVLHRERVRRQLQDGLPPVNAVGIGVVRERRELGVLRVTQAAVAGGHVDVAGGVDGWSRTGHPDAGVVVERRGDEALDVA